MVGLNGGFHATTAEIFLGWNISVAFFPEVAWQGTKPWKLHVLLYASLDTVAWVQRNTPDPRLFEFCKSSKSLAGKNSNVSQTHLTCVCTHLRCVLGKCRINI